MSKDLHEIYWLLLNYFGDLLKVYEWMHTDNPGLGNLAPMYLVYIGQESKVLKFIVSNLRGDIP